MENERGNKYALAALKKQRAKLAGEILADKQALKWKQSQLEHLDCTLRLLDPDLDPAGLPASRPRKRFKLFRQGELGQLIRDAMRRAGEPVGLHDLVSALLAKGGYQEDARRALEHRVRSNLCYLESKGSVSRVPGSLITQWSLT